MNKPMYCPLSFANSDRVFAWGTDDGVHINKRFYPVECIPECAWAVKSSKDYMCIVAVDALYGRGLRPNGLPLKDDSE